MRAKDKQILKDWSGYDVPETRFFNDEKMVAFARYYAERVGAVAHSIDPIQKKAHKKDLIDFLNWIAAGGEDIFYEKPEKVVSEFLNTDK